MKTLLGTPIPESIRGIVYLCNFDPVKLELHVFNELLCTSPADALEAYANIPNPPSQIATGKDFPSLCDKLEELHKNMKNPIWLAKLEKQL